MIGRFILSLATPCIAGIYKKFGNLLEETIYRDYVYGKIYEGSGPVIELLFSRTLKPSALARKQSGVAQAASKPGIFTLFIKIPGNPPAQHIYRPDCNPIQKMRHTAQSSKPRVRSFMLPAAALIIFALSSCSMHQLYTVGQAWQRNDCNKLIDMYERQRCADRSDTSYETYQRQAGEIGNSK